MNKEDLAETQNDNPGRKPRGLTFDNEHRERLVAMMADLTQPAINRLKAKAMLYVEAKTKFRVAARNLEISTSTLYRWARDYRSGGLDKLVQIRPMNRAFYVP